MKMLRHSQLCTASPPREVPVGWSPPGGTSTFTESVFGAGPPSGTRNLPVAEPVGTRVIFRTVSRSRTVATVGAAHHPSIATDASHIVFDGTVKCSGAKVVTGNDIDGNGPITARNVTVPLNVASFADGAAKITVSAFAAGVSAGAPLSAPAEKSKRIGTMGKLIMHPARWARSKMLASEHAIQEYVNK